MKILQLSTKVPYPPKDGGAAGVFVFSEVLHELGHSVTILAVNPPKHYVHASEYNEILTAINIQTVPINTNPNWLKAIINLLFKTSPYQVDRFIDKTFETKLKDILLSQKPDIVQIEGVYLCPYIPVIRKYSTSRIVLRSHNIEHLLWKDIASNEKNLFKRLYLRIQAQRLKNYEIRQFSKVDGITSVTEDDLKVIKAISATNARLIPYGIHLQGATTAKKLNTKSIAFIGALDWWPNQEAIHWFIEEVWPEIHKAFPALTFHIAGRNAPSLLVSKIKLQPNVVFHGEVADSKAFLQQFSIMIVPLFSGSGIRVKIIEAMQQGLVVIASEKAAEGIPATPGKHMLIANTSSEFLSELSRLLPDNKLIEEISTNAMALVKEKFDILAIGSQLTDFYKEICND